MAKSQANRTWVLVSRWAIRVFATIEAIDALTFMQNGDPNPEFILILLTALGMVGLVVVWLSTLLPGREWIWLGAGALMVAVAPAVFYPASAVLFLLGLAAFAFGAGLDGTKEQPPSEPALAHQP